MERETLRLFWSTHSVMNTTNVKAMILLAGALFLGCEKGEPQREDLLAQNHGRWQFIGTSSDNEHYYYNRELVRVTESGTITLWIKDIDPLPEPKTTGERGFQVTDLPHSLYRLEVSCAKEEIRFLETVVVDESGKRRTRASESSNWEAVVPDTIGHQWYRAACSTPESVDDKIWKFVRTVGEVLTKEEKKSNDGGDGE